MSLQYWSACIGMFIGFGLVLAQSTSSRYGRFEGELKVKLLENGAIQLLEPYAYVDPYGKKWVAPKGTVSDGASIPQWAWSFVGGPLDGNYRDAAVIHDVGCVDKNQRWDVVHRIFYYAMLAKRTQEWKAKVMYAAVYHFGPRWTIPGQEPTPAVLKQEDFATLVSQIKRSDGEGQALIASTPEVANKKAEFFRRAREEEELHAIEVWRP